MQKRPPIVAVMGHVDHGKTTLLDYIRKTTVAEREAGGITQAIGAYEIVHNGKKITFIDTPGHEAFSRMRAESARLADIAILVVATDDGVKPQTKNALQYIQEEKIPFIVAMNKIDKSNSDIEKTKNDLMNAGVFLEGSGGNVSWHEVSAKTGEGVSELLDLLILATDVEDLKYDEFEIPSGYVITSKLDARRGIIVGVVVKNGILKINEPIATESARGKIKILSNFLGEQVRCIEPSAPALIVGFETLPKVGEEFFAGKGSMEICNEKKQIEPARKDFIAEKNDGNYVRVVLKADEVGSLNAVKEFIEKIQATIPIRVVSNGIGDIYENDIKAAEQMKGIVVGFKVKIDKAALNMARSQKITVMQSGVIYEFEKELKLYAQKISPKALRAIEILAVFGVPKGKEKVVGGRVVLGPIKTQESFEIWNGEKMMGTGRILNLQSNRKDIIEAVLDQEVGLLIESDESIKVGNRFVFLDTV